MQGTRLKEKVNIFISSNCGGRYTLVREALRLLLLETGSGFYEAGAVGLV